MKHLENLAMKKKISGTSVTRRQVPLTVWDLIF